MLICSVNAGSSSLKISLFKKGVLEAVWSGILENWNEDSAIKFLKNVLDSYDPSSIGVVGHRFVHGGEKFVDPLLLTDDSLIELEALTHLAPLHNPKSLLGVQIVKSVLPDVPQVAVFDTAFHGSIPEQNYTYALPEKYRSEGIRRFGFHGISYASCIETLRRMLGDLPDKIIACHLGSGCSLAAIQGGHSIDTTMGFTPMEGLVMGTRCGSIDPGILFYLLRNQRVKAEELDYELNFSSGLLALAGTQDMRIIAQNLGLEQNFLSFDLFCRSAAKEVAKMAVSLGGVDLLAFTGGIGENSMEVRAKIIALLSFMGFELDAALNAQGVEGAIHVEGSSKSIYIITSREALWIAQQAELFL